MPDVSYGPSSTATVHITVLDVNEGPVFYPDPMTVTRWENISVGSVLLTVNAMDPDTLQHQTIRCVGASVTRDGAEGARHELLFLSSCQGWWSGASYRGSELRELGARVAVESRIPRGKEKGVGMYATHPASQTLDLPYCYHNFMRKALADSLCR